MDDGGLGDRVGGLISAIMIAIRFKRTFLIEDEDGFTKLFRPFRNPSKHNPDFFSNKPPSENKFTYLNTSSWTKYDSFKDVNFNAEHKSVF
jgi:hypothetical protein